jgi:hypothetical protein
MEQPPEVSAATASADLVVESDNKDSSGVGGQTPVLSEDPAEINKQLPPIRISYK